MYQSPIQTWMDELKTSFDDNVVRAVQNYDIHVDKDEMIKALRYDRDQYELGYREGFLAGYAQAVEDIREKINSELTSSLDKAILEGLK